MKSQTIFNVIQTLTGLAILAGLILVVLELQQSRELARAQLTADGFARSMESELVIMGENFAEVYAKACLRPDELTEGEIAQMDASYSRVITSLRRRRSYDHIGEGRVFDFNEAVLLVLRFELGTEIGRIEYEMRRDSYPDWLREPGDVALATADDCREALAEKMRRLKEG